MELPPHGNSTIWRTGGGKGRVQTKAFCRRMRGIQGEVKGRVRTKAFRKPTGGVLGGHGGGQAKIIGAVAPGQHGAAGG